MEDHASQLANKAAAAASKRNAGPELASVLTEVCGLLVSLNARVSSLENEAGFREYSSYEPGQERSSLPPSHQEAAPCDSLGSEPAQPSSSPNGKPDNVGEERPAPVTPAPMAPILPQEPKKKEQPVATATAGPAPYPEMSSPSDPSEVMLEMSERFASMSRKQAALYAAAIKAGKAPEGL